MLIVSATVWLLKFDSQEKVDPESQSCHFVVSNLQTGLEFYMILSENVPPNPILTISPCLTTACFIRLLMKASVKGATISYSSPFLVMLFEFSMTIDCLSDVEKIDPKETDVEKIQ